MDESISQLYFNWLCAKVRENSGLNHIELFYILYNSEFVWDISVPGDKNRIADGKDLRRGFFKEEFIKQNQELLNQPCSIFELLISFCNHAHFQTDIPVKIWFWELIDNLKLKKFQRVTGNDEYEINDIIYVFVWRLYDNYGNGGLFPLHETMNDQRKVELWYQFFEYLDEKFPV